MLEKIIYTSIDLKFLSSSILYDKGYIKSTDAGDDDTPTFNFYNWLIPKRFGETTLGIQEPGESHEDYAKRMKDGGGFDITPPSSFSSGGGY